MQKRRVVVTGCGIVSCFGNDVNEFYNKLLQGESGVKTITGFDCTDFSVNIGAEVKEFDPDGYVDKKQARRIDPFILYALVAGKKALQSAQLPIEPSDLIDKHRAGIIIGSGMGGLNYFADGVNVLNTKGVKRLTPFFIPYIITNMAGALLGIDVGYMGPNYSVSTACATSNYAINLAANHIRNNEADIMICGGSEAGICPIGLGGFIANKALADRNDEPTKASRPWDKDRNGFVIGEGSGVIVLESLESALKRGAPILAEYRGGAFTCDSYHMTAPREDGLGVMTCIDLALKDAGVTKEEVNYINAHGTSTGLGDIAEARAINKYFGSHSSNIKMNSTKSMIGHPLGAAGGIEAVVAIQAIQTGKIHPTINLDNPEEVLGDIDPVRHVAQDLDVNVAISNSFGFGGHNSVIAFSKYTG